MATFGCITVQHPVCSLLRVLLTRLAASLENLVTRRAVVDVISGATNVSLRMLDWLVTNYAKRTALCLRSPTGKTVHVFDSYRNTLAQYRRRNFDPFCRSQRRSDDGQVVHFLTAIEDASGARHTTTIGQLHFLVWATETGLMRYAAAERDAIVKDMQMAGAGGANKQGARRKRRTLSATAPGACRAYAVRRTVHVK